MEGSSFEAKGLEFKRKADKVLKGSFLGNFMRGKQDRADEAKDLYQQAANCYKLAQNFDEALNCYQKCIECEEKETDAAPYYRDAANCIKETNLDKFCELTKKAVELYALTGRSSTGASMAKECATLLEE